MGSTTILRSDAIQNENSNTSEISLLNNRVLIRNLGVKTPPLNELGGRLLLPNGEIAQIVNGKAIQYIAYIEFTANSELRRGNHYHNEKEEYLYVIKGKIKILFEDIDTLERAEVLVEAGDLINTKARCAHVYTSLLYSQSIEFSPSKYDPNDTIKYEIKEN